MYCRYSALLMHCILLPSKVLIAEHLCIDQFALAAVHSSLLRIFVQFLVYVFLFLLFYLSHYNSCIIYLSIILKLKYVSYSLAVNIVGKAVDKLETERNFNWIKLNSLFVIFNFTMFNLDTVTSGTVPLSTPWLPRRVDPSPIFQRR